MLQRLQLRKSDIIVPVFVIEGTGHKIEVPSMPGVFQMSIDVASEWLTELSDAGFRSYIVFGVPDRSKKDEIGSEALNPENLVCQLIRKTKSAGNPMVAMTDLCFCEYTSHGHCGPLTSDKQTVDNDITLSLLSKQAINHARAGADVIAPSGMMDNMIAAIRTGLDEAGFIDLPILSYAVKYASAFYGPFRDAADSAPSFGDRKTYQMDPARGPDEAITEALSDIDQGADMVMVKPAGAYLDIIRAVREKVNVPVVAYQVSGEYAMIQAAAKNNWIDGDRVILESLLSIKRAGADLIISYFAPQLIKLLET